MIHWAIDRIVHFGPDDFVKSGFAHFGFHDRRGRHYAVSHQNHFLALVGDGDVLEWTAAPGPVFAGVPNITADIAFPMFVDGHALGMVDMGNCVVDGEGCVWINEVQGCRVWRFDPGGRVLRVLGDGEPGFQRETTDFEDVRFNWIYDIRRGPDDSLYVLDSRNFALRVVDIAARCVRTVAGSGAAGYDGDGGTAAGATFGSDRTARFDGPISLSLDEEGNVFIGDRFNQVVRMIDSSSGLISTIAGRHGALGEGANDPAEREPLQVKLPKISSMEYHGGRLLVPTDLTPDFGDLVVLTKR